MWRWRRIAVARVFALVGAMQDYAVITLFSRCKNRDNQEGVPGGSRAGRTATT
jgi:hypothetical protein